MENLTRLYFQVLKQPDNLVLQQRFEEVGRDCRVGAFATLKRIRNFLAGSDLNATIYASHPHVFCFRPMRVYLQSTINLGFIMQGEIQQSVYSYEVGSTRQILAPPLVNPF